MIYIVDALEVDISIIQKFDPESPLTGFILKKGDTITIDGQTYVADYVGAMVVSDMKALGHATLFFNQKKSKNPLANAVYLTLVDKQTLPEFKHFVVLPCNLVVQQNFICLKPC